MSRRASYFSLTSLFTACACFVDYAFVIVVINNLTTTTTTTTTLKVMLAKRQRQHSIPESRGTRRRQSSTVCSRGDQQVYGIGGCTEWGHPRRSSGKVPRQSCWRWPEKRLDPSSRKRKRNKHLTRLYQYFRFTFGCRLLLSFRHLGFSKILNFNGVSRSNGCRDMAI